ncbi:MAG: HAD-IA family hydrolase [Bacteroidaceae bacterium]|nr:HAD-IA family hydrolase [Bacteroidaceae bacterium]
MSFSLKNKSAILFDMDGVLYDSMPNHSKAWSQAMEKFGMHMTPHDVYLNEGATGHDTVVRISLRDRGYEATDSEIDEIYGYKAELFRSMPEARVMPGALEVFRKAAAAGLKILIVTGSGQKNLIERVQKDFEGYITRDRMVTAFEVTRGKPYPDPYLKGLEIAGVSAADAVVVENAPLGIRAAVAAGIDTIAVNTGPLADEILLAEGPKALFRSMEKLASDFDTLLLEKADVKLSVIVPAYNAQNYIRPTLDNILEQEMPGMEVICVDDGSTDSTLEIMREYESRDNRIVVVTKPNGRLGSARNAGLNVAKGEYVAYVDSDDFISAGYFNTLYKAAVKYDADIAMCDIKRVKGNSSRCFFNIKDFVVTDDTARKLRICHCPPSFFSVNMLVRRSVIESAGLRFPEKVYYEDATYTFRLLCVSGRLVTVPGPQYIYIHHPGSIVHSHQTPVKQRDKYNAHKEVARIAREYGVELPAKFLNITKRHWSLGPLCLLKIREREGVETFYLFDFIPVWRRKATGPE